MLQGTRQAHPHRLKVQKITAAWKTSGIPDGMVQVPLKYMTCFPIFLLETIKHRNNQSTETQGQHPKITNACVVKKHVNDAADTITKCKIKKLGTCCSGREKNYRLAPSLYIISTVQHRKNYQPRLGKGHLWHLMHHMHSYAKKMECCEGACFSY